MLQASLNWGNKKDEPVFVTEESGVVGLNFHQSKEMLINESNGHLDVSAFAARHAVPCHAPPCCRPR